MELTDIKITPIIDSLRLENIDDQIYFSTKYSDYISNSRLGLINPNQGGSPNKYKAGFGGNKIFSDSLIFGSAIHEMQLQPESFFLVDEIDRPTSKAGFISDLVYKSFKENGEVTDKELISAAIEVDYYHGILSEKKMIELRDKITPYLISRKNFEESYIGTKEPCYLDPKNRERFYACSDALNKNKQIQDLLHPKGLLEDPLSMNERTILCDVKVEVKDLAEPFILRLKSKLDNFTIDKENNVITVNDIKTCGKMVNEFDTWSIPTFHYNREIAMYGFLLNLVAEKYFDMKQPTIKGNFLVVSTIPNYYTKVTKMKASMFKEGFNEFKYLLRLVAYNEAIGWKCDNEL